MAELHKLLVIIFLSIFFLNVSSASNGSIKAGVSEEGERKSA